MNARELLAKNFKKLRDATPGLSAPKDIVNSGAATNGTIGRINKMESGPSIDTVDQLAAAYGLQAWQMLVPTLEARASVNGRPVVTGCTIGGWPFPDIDRERFDRLSLRQQIEIQGVVRERIERFEGGDGGLEGVRGNGTHGR